jgi:hypothetical protein
MAKFSFNPNTEQRLVAFELEDIEWANGVTKPAVKIGFVSNASNDIADLVSLKQRSGKSGPVHRSLLNEFSESNLCFRTKREAENARKELGWRLAESGYSVNATLTKLHRIYVVELKTNPFTDEDLAAVYVGRTSTSADERINQHLNGDKSAKTSKLMTIRRIDLEPGETHFSHSSYNAEVLETAWGRELEARGFRVFGPTGFSTSKKLRASSS